MKNKRAQVSETIVWVVATLIIVLVLLGSIFISSLLGKAKSINVGDIDLSSQGEDVDLLEIKTDFSYSLSSEENKEIIDKWREENE